MRAMRCIAERHLLQCSESPAALGLLMGPMLQPMLGTSRVQLRDAVDDQCCDDDCKARAYVGADRKTDAH